MPHSHQRPQTRNVTNPLSRSYTVADLSSLPSPSPHSSQPSQPCHLSLKTYIHIRVQDKSPNSSTTLIHRRNLPPKITGAESKEETCTATRMRKMHVYDLASSSSSSNCLIRSLWSWEPEPEWTFFFSDSTSVTNWAILSFCAVIILV